MRRAFIVAAATLVACGGGGDGGNDNVQSYKAAATVGDFLALTVNHDTNEIEYVNVSNGDEGTVGFTVLPDGGLEVTDPNGDLVLCYEMPGVAIACKGAELGTGTGEPALLLGVLDEPLEKADLEGLGGVGFMQFRTREGGIEVGHIVFDAGGNASGSGYFPINEVLPQPPACYGKTKYNALDMSTEDFSDDPTYGCVQRTEDTPNGPQTSRIFGTPGGNFMVDTPNGALFAFRDAASTAFDPADAGTYSALVYNKHVTYDDGTETPAGPASIETALVEIDATGHVTVTQGTETPFVSEALLPFDDSPHQGAGAVTQSVPGLFYFMDGDDYVFVTFFDGALAFATFHPIHTGDCVDDPAEYSYTYGIAVRAPEE
jgi:hypothetical protein